MQTIHEFFKEVYTQKQADSHLHLQQQFLENVNKKLNEQDKQILDLPITLDEIQATIRNTDTNKSPGIDGLPIEFYQTFWPILKNELQEIANLIYIKRQNLNMSQRTGIISLTHKRDEKEDLENWRPVTLLCADYKIITKTIATRLRRYLSQIININQTCAVPNREITSNLYLIRDIIKYAQYKEINTFVFSTSLRLY